MIRRPRLFEVRRVHDGLSLIAALLAIMSVAAGPRSPVSAQQPGVPEISTQETQPKFTIRARANEVLVRVVVRDAQGKAVPNLTKDDFRLSDSGKPQVIREFSVELSRSAAAGPVQKSNLPTAEKPSEEQVESTAAAPERFAALYFDDTYMPFEDVVRTRDAAERFLKSSVTLTDRVGLYTSSGQGNVDFTSDRGKLEEVLANLRPRPSGSNQTSDCPNISQYEAYLIAEREEQDALTLGKSKVINCMCTGPTSVTTPSGSVPVNPCNFDPEQYAKATAREIWERAQLAARQSLRGLEALVRRLSAMPGQRSIAWVSPGFLAMDQDYELSTLIDQALRARVVINALDSRGLWTLIPGGDASQKGSGLNGSMAAVDVQFAQASEQIRSGVMAAASSGTGGVFVHDSNDYDAGFRKVGALPEVAYLLSFSPENLKYDGRYHNLKVELVNGRGLSLQARKGYFAPKEAPDSERQAKEDIEEAVFAREERKDLPLEVQTQFFMLSQTDGQLSVLARLDLHGVRLHKEQQRNVDELRFATVLFDQDGNLLEGQARTIDLRLEDATLNRLMVGGLRLGWHFKVKPGTYVIREVVWDGGSGGIAALSRTVEIPYPK